MSLTIIPFAHNPSTQYPHHVLQCRYLPSEGSPFSTHMLHMNGAATPISDLSDRDAMFSAGSALTGTTGLYGDFEDDLVSAGSNNDDEYISQEKV